MAITIATFTKGHRYEVTIKAKGDGFEVDFRNPEDGKSYFSNPIYKENLSGAIKVAMLTIVTEESQDPGIYDVIEEVWKTNG